MQSQLSLEGLPMEVLGEIGSHMRVQDLREFSLASKRMCEGVARHLFHSVIFAGDKAEVMAKLLDFLSRHERSERLHRMKVVCKSVSVVVIAGADNGYDEAPDVLPSLLLSTIRKFPQPSCIGITTQGLNARQESALSRQLRDMPRWTTVRSIRMDVPQFILKNLGRFCLDQVPLRGFNLIPFSTTASIDTIHTYHRGLKNLRVAYRTPLFEIVNFSTGNLFVDVAKLTELETIVFGSTDHPREILRSRSITSPARLKQIVLMIADALEGSDHLQSISIYFRTNIMSWIRNQASTLWPGSPNRVRLNNHLARATRAVGEKLQNLQQFCLVEVDPDNVIRTIHYGRRVEGSLQISIESPGFNDAFPIGITF
ncbi:hypothetical protein F53441_8078 [Fusarium austroafricanum]|uniref:F-box domain-containing protein n=1 Tax=Fusarium austroafricanum TaxID=2364996 RepID=A0A8H4KC32_9HYPO|nr:hypothetical protein F53441_8078 [Fusarium austroafricanum]